MKSKFSGINLPLLQDNRKTHFNFFSVCIKAIKDNKDGVLDKNECIKNIIKLREEKFKKKHFNKTSLYLKPLKIEKKSSMINKKRSLSQILAECQKNDNSKNLNTNLSSQILIVNNNESEKDKPNIEDKKRSSKSQIPRISTINKKPIDKEQNISKRYATFKKINEYLESNNIALFELLKYNPFQKIPYGKSMGYEFLQAVKFKNFDFVFEALQKSTDYLFVYDYFGQTAYHWAAKLGNIKMLKLLLEFGKYLNQKDFKGRTPLYLAAVNDDREMCDLLIKNKANIHLKDINGKSAADVAKSKELRYYLGDLMTLPYSNSIYKLKVAEYLRQRDKKIQQDNVEKKKKENEKQVEEQKLKEKEIFEEEN
jgi:hypothetical protein